MDWLNIHTSTLDSPAFVGSTPTERSTWLCLQRFCIGQENGGVIVGARVWKDRQWQQLARVTLREVTTTAKLWTWRGDDLVVEFYPLEKETEVKAKREGGRATAAKRWPSSAPSSPDSSVTSSPSISADAEGERKGKEGNGKEDNTGAPPAGGDAVVVPAQPPSVPFPVLVPPSLDTPAFNASWAEWLKYRRERHLPNYKTVSLRKTFKQLEAWGEPAAIASIDESIRNNWQGLFPPRVQPGQNRPAPKLESDMSEEEFKKRFGNKF